MQLKERDKLFLARYCILYYDYVKSYRKREGDILKLCVRMFGTSTVQVDDRNVTIPYRRAEALLYYLVLEKRASRQELAALLWEDAEPEIALKNLRHAVYTIRRTLGGNFFREGSRTVLELNPEIPIYCDVLNFLVEGKREVYRGEFLTGFTLCGACAFEEWMMTRRNLLKSKFLRDLLSAAQEALLKGDLEQAERFGLEYIAWDPLEEAAYVILMELYSKQKTYRKAIEIYHRLCNVLETELGISPLNDTTALYNRVVDAWHAVMGQKEKRRNSIIFGKKEAMESLLSMSRHMETREYPCLFIQGNAGVGKSYLLEHVLKFHHFSEGLILRCCSYQTEMGRALAAWNSLMLDLLSEMEKWEIQIPERYLQAASRLFPCLAVRYRWDLEGPEGSGYGDYAARESALLIFSIVAKQLPLLLVFEDIQWMDHASVNMLSAFLRRLNGTEAGVVCTLRELSNDTLKKFAEQAQQDKLLKICTIPNLSREETGQFLRHYYDGTVSEDEMDQVYLGTGGNTRFLSQLAHSLRGRGKTAVFSQAVGSMISDRLSQLTAEESQVLNVISAFPGLAPVEVLSDILREKIMDLIYLCGRLKQQMLIIESDCHGSVCYEVAHDFVRQAIVQRQPKQIRQMLCLYVMQYLDGRLKEREEFTERPRSLKGLQ